MLLKTIQQNEPTTPDPCPADSPRPKVHSFSKVLTASERSTHGGFSVLRKHATECLPPLVGNSFFLMKLLKFYLFDLNISI